MGLFTISVQFLDSHNSDLHLRYTQPCPPDEESLMFCRFNRLLVTFYLVIASTTTFALSAGEIQLNSWLGEPLVAEFQLSSVNNLSTEQIKIKLAPKAIVEKFDVAHTGFQQHLTFKLMQNDKGINVAISTEDPIKEPFQHFVLQILWPEGELYKEFKILIDPKQ
jgi:pilus assembly protein FimV